MNCWTYCLLERALQEVGITRTHILDGEAFRIMCQRWPVILWPSVYEFETRRSGAARTEKTEGQAKPQTRPRRYFQVNTFSKNCGTTPLAVALLADKLYDAGRFVSPV